MLQLVLAIGGQCQLRSDTSLQCSRKYFARGQQIAFEGILEDLSIRIIQSFLLMALYLFGACRRMQLSCIWVWLPEMLMH